MPRGVQQQVRRLDVAVEDALPVGVLQGVGHLDADPGHALPVASAASYRPPSGPGPGSTTDEEESENESDSRPARDRRGRRLAGAPGAR